MVNEGIEQNDLVGLTNRMGVNCWDRAPHNRKSLPVERVYDTGHERGPQRKLVLNQIERENLVITMR